MGCGVSPSENGRSYLLDKIGVSDKLYTVIGTVSVSTIGHTENVSFISLLLNRDFFIDLSAKEKTNFLESLS